MTNSTDYTRWNRAGLSRFRYVDGNAITFLEDLRIAFKKRPNLAGWEVHPDGEPAYGDPQWASWEDADERAERLLAQYKSDPKDWAWEIARTFSRALHVLMEYADVYANEGFIGTATQWENVRRLVGMLAYHPAPPASASTSLLIAAKEDAGGVIPAGFRVQYVSEDGNPPVVFETLEDIEIDSRLNEFRPKNARRNLDWLSGTELALEGEIEGLRAGECLVLQSNAGASAHLIEGYLYDAEKDATKVQVFPKLPKYVTGDTLVHFAPEDALDLLGPFNPGFPGSRGETSPVHVQLTAEPGDLMRNEVVYITDGKKAFYRRVKAVRGRRLVVDEPIGEFAAGYGSVGRPVEVGVSEIVYRRKKSGARQVGLKVAGDWSRLQGQLIVDRKPTLLERRVISADYLPADAAPVESFEQPGFTILRTLVKEGGLRNPQSILVPPPGPGPWTTDVAVVKDKDGRPPPTLTTSSPSAVAPGDYVVVSRGRQLALAEASALAITRDGDEAEITIAKPWRQVGGGPYFLADTTVFAHFTEVVRPKGWQTNNKELSGAEISLEEVPAALTRGRRVVVAGGKNVTRLTTVTNVQGAKLTVAPPLDSKEGFTVGNITIHGNVVLAGHGERRQEQVLGSGDAAQRNQSFELAETNVAFVSDPTMPAGVRADLEVKVEERIWTQVATLNDSDPSESHYSVRMTEDRTLLITFGDGTHGRRLPTGVNNIRVAFRAGTGLNGNVIAQSLTQPVVPHALIDSVEQPIAANGGNDMEDVMSLKENAPATVLTLTRAVALEDFAHLAAANSSVWQARARRKNGAPSRHEGVEVIVVPAGGGELGTLQESLVDYLKLHAQPNLDIVVTPHSLIALNLSVSVRVDSSAFDPALVVENVNRKLIEAFSLRARKLGQPLYISDVYRVVEHVEGVENSVVQINEGTLLPKPGQEPLPEHRVGRATDKSIRSIRPFDRQVIAFHLGKPALVVEFKEYVL